MDFSAASVDIRLNLQYHKAEPEPWQARWRKHRPSLVKEDYDKLIE
ncbi:MAG TPA: hypothetical protein VGO67_23275 [Verrucomicrobiae bacterium]|jgi:hypothetical protein